MSVRAECIGRAALEDRAEPWSSDIPTIPTPEFIADGLAKRQGFLPVDAW